MSGEGGCHGRESRDVSRRDAPLADLRARSASCARDSALGADRWVRQLPDPLLLALGYDWPTWARAGQVAPEGDWRVWLLMAGRGYGKTRAGAEWVRARATGRACQIALVGATEAEARSVMVEGPSGLLAVCAPHEGAQWEPSKGTVRFANGSMARVFSGANPEALRGPNFAAAWCDEIAKWEHAEPAWDNLQMALRVGAKPQAVVTTTPRAVPILRRLLSDPRTAVTRGATTDNELLPEAYLAAMEAAYAGTRLGRQELAGELIEDVEGTLFPRALLDAARGREVGEVVRVVVAVDPPASATGDACGIVVAGVDAAGRGVVLADASIERASPEAWARAVAEAAARHGADRVVAEANNGGAMVEAVLRAADAALPVRLVHASRGKVARAEPVAALYEAGRVAHSGVFARLEDELAGLTVGGGYGGPGRSPDRADAAVWALSELMLGKTGGPARVRVL